MSKNNILVFFIVIVSFLFLPVKAETSCLFVNKDYSSRDSNSYNEGLLSNSKINSDFKLVSFSISSISDNIENTLKIKIPKVTNDIPDILVREFEKQYKLDKVKKISTENNKFYTFNWSSCVIQKADIDINKLSFLASLPVSQKVFLPIVFGEGGDKYNFVFKTPKPTVIKSFQIKQSETVVYAGSDLYQIGGELALTWNGLNQFQNKAQSGLYNLYIDVEITDVFEGSVESFSEQISFYHNPQWLKQ